jgi:MerR family transcriptional regulator, copper efflux regulator
MDRMRISQLAARSGVPASTLRFYESAGLLPAARSAAGYRLYGEEAVERLGLISTAKRLGLPLEEIGDLLAVWETGTCAQVKADLRPRITARLAQAAQRAAEIDAFTAALRGALEHVEAFPDRADRCGPGCGFLTTAPPPTGTPAGPAHGRDADGDDRRWRTAPVACSLPSGDLPCRAAAWREAISGAAAAGIPDGMRLTLPASRAAAVAGLAAAEQDCCPFLDFRLHLDGPVLHLEVRAPGDAAGLLTALFTPDRSPATHLHLGQRPQAAAPNRAEQ